MRAAAAGAAVIASLSTPALAETLRTALTQAYQNNPQLNAQRAALRVTDEGVPQALSGYRPRISVTAEGTRQSFDTLTQSPTNFSLSRTRADNGFQSYRGTITQTLFNGHQTASRTRQAEQLVSAGRETLRTTEQTVLLSAATSYMNLIRDEALLQLDRKSTV